MDSQIQTFFSLIVTLGVKVFEHLQSVNFLWDMDINLHLSATPKLIRSTFLKVQLVQFLALISVGGSFDIYILVDMKKWILKWMKCVACVACTIRTQMWGLTMWSLCCVMLPSLPLRAKASGSLCAPGLYKASTQRVRAHLLCHMFLSQNGLLHPMHHDPQQDASVAGCTVFGLQNTRT